MSYKWRKVRSPIARMETIEKEKKKIFGRSKEERIWRQNAKVVNPCMIKEWSHIPHDPLSKSLYNGI